MSKLEEDGISLEIKTKLIKNHKGTVTALKVMDNIIKQTRLMHYKAIESVFIANMPDKVLKETYLRLRNEMKFRGHDL